MRLADSSLRLRQDALDDYLFTLNVDTHTRGYWCQFLGIASPHLEETVTIYSGVKAGIDPLEEADYYEVVDRCILHMNPHDVKANEEKYLMINVVSGDYRKKHYFKFESLYPMLKRSILRSESYQTGFVIERPQPINN